MAKDFGTRLLQAAKKGKYKPGVFLPILEDLEEMLFQYQKEKMDDKEITIDEKGRIACTVNDLIIGVRARKVAITTAHTEEAKAEMQPRLHNTHLQ